MTQKHNCKIGLRDTTEAEIAKTLRGALAQYDVNPLRTWRWWSGFIWGAIIIAAMDFGDVHLCLGQCDGKGLIGARVDH